MATAYAVVAALGSLAIGSESVNCPTAVGGQSDIGQGRHHRVGRRHSAQPQNPPSYVHRRATPGFGAALRWTYDGGF
ncbi:hypothetical protein MAHJHV59_47900 [Mycobacterium avium subsp. hominissuis]